MDPETSLVCVDCGITYTMMEKEYQRFKDLAAQNPTFRMPKRCADCRRIRRLQAVPTVQPAPVRGGYIQQLSTRPRAPIPFQAPHQAPSAYQPPPPQPVPIVSDPAPASSEEEINFVLATKDFDDLVNGRPVVWRGVRVVLADIGFESMKKAIEEAEIARARKLVKANGH